MSHIRKYDTEKRKEYDRKYYLKNKAKRIAQTRVVYEKNKKINTLKRKIYYKKYSLENKEKISLKNKLWYQKVKEERLEYWRDYDAKKRKTCKNYVIKKRLRTRLNQEKIRYLEKGKCLPSKKYKINYQKIIDQLKPFPQNISEFHIDHIRPLCTFDLTDPKQMQDATAPENHQWLSAEQNMIKGKKYGQK